MSERRRGWALGAAAVLVVGYAALCKGLLFRNLEYLGGTDLFSFLEIEPHIKRNPAGRQVPVPIRTGFVCGLLVIAIVG